MLYLVDSEFNVIDAPIENEYFVVKAFNAESAIANVKDHIDPNTPSNSWVVKHCNKPPTVIKPRTYECAKEYEPKSVSRYLMDFISMATGGFSGY